HVQRRRPADALRSGAGRAECQTGQSRGGGTGQCLAAARHACEQPAPGRVRPAHASSRMQRNAMRVALLGASHWHVPLYLDALERSGVRVVAVSDREAVHGAAIAQRFGCPCLRTDEELLQRYDLDFAFAFGRHVDLPRTGEMLVARRIPFAIEKPCGVNADDVARLRAQAEAAGLYVAVPFIQRMGDLLRRIRETEAALPTRLHHASFRFIGGPLSRYRNGSAWMLDLSQYGGGCTINLGVHFIDLFRLLTGQEIIGVRALMSNRSQGAEVEDYSALLLTAADATVGLVETGY